MTSSTLQPTFLNFKPLYLLNFISIYDVIVCGGMGVCVPHSIYVKITCGNQLSPTIWVPGLELRSSDLDSNCLYTK